MHADPLKNITLRFLRLAPAFALLAGCGGTNPQPTVIGSSADPLSGGMMPNGSLGTGAMKGNAARKQPDLGVDSSMNGFEPFDAKSDWNKSIDKSALDPNSDKIIASFGKDVGLSLDFGAANKDGKPFGIPYLIVSGDAPRATVTFSTKGEDPAQYPYPLLMPIEPGTAAHAIVIDRDGLKAYETSGTVLEGDHYKATTGTVWDLRSDEPPKAGQISADGSGLPVFPGLVRYDEVDGTREISHALRFTLSTLRKGFVAPATRSVGTKDDPDLPPAGMRIRLKAKVDVSKYPSSTKVILKAMKKYGMFLADTGNNFALSGTPDMKWDDKDLATLTQLKATDFEVVKMGTVKGLKDEPADATAKDKAPSAAGK